MIIKVLGIKNIIIDKFKTQKISSYYIQIKIDFTLNTVYLKIQLITVYNITGIVFVIKRKSYFIFYAYGRWQIT